MFYSFIYLFILFIYHNNNAPKIKIVDVVAKELKNDDYAVTVDEVEKSELPVENEASETTEETTTIIQEKNENAREDVSTSAFTSEPAKQIREQQLVKCEKCGKCVTPKTLKYTHSLKCDEVKKSRPNKSEIKINENVQEETPPSPVPIQKVGKDKPQPVLQQHTKPPIVKQVVKSYEDLRRDKVTERLKQRAERNINLFKQVF